MTRPLCAAAVLVLFHLTTHAQLAKAVRGCSASNGLTQAEITEILTRHNKPRAELSLPLLAWDCKLAKAAQEWADRGVFEHHAGYSYGESLFASSNSTAKAAAAVQQWMLERSAWNNKTASCSAGKTCTHYTQIVWRKTAIIGCGINRSAPGKWKVLLVCNYDPAGNGAGPPY
jgi:pathogenesis-related protein 1